MYRDFLDYLPLLGFFFAIIITAAIIAAAVLTLFLISKCINKIIFQNEQGKNQKRKENEAFRQRCRVDHSYEEWKAERDKQQEQ